MAKLGFQLYKDQIKDCVLNSIEKLLFMLISAWVTYVNYCNENFGVAIGICIATIVYTILFIFTLRDTIKAVKEYRKIRKDWENYGK